METRGHHKNNNVWPWKLQMMDTYKGVHFSVYYAPLKEYCAASISSKMFFCTPKEQIFFS